MSCRLTFRKMAISRNIFSLFIRASNYFFWIISDIIIRLSEIVVCRIVSILWWLSSSCFQKSCLYKKKDQISDNFCILQNVVPDFIDTDNCPLRMFPVLFLLLFCLLVFIRSNTFGIVKKLACLIKLPSADIDTVQ